MGMCVAGGGYLPVMCDHVLMTDGSGLFLAGPALVQAAIGQKTSAEELGGAAMHSTISGTVDFHEPSEESCLARIRSIIEKWGYRRQSPWDRKKPVSPALASEEIYGIYDSSPARPYDIKEVIARITDASKFDEYKSEYGKTLVCGYARIGGFAVGIVANQKLHAQATDHEGRKRMEFGGVIYTESAEKAARFIMDCNQNLVPLVFLHDVNGFMVGRDAEWSGIIKAGAKMVNAVSNSVVPKITVILGGSFGAGHYAMCGKAYDPRLVFAWPTAKYAVMGGDAAAGTLVEIKIRQLERSGKVLSEEDKKQLYESTKQIYDEQMDPRYGAARLWIDRIIDPVETRDAITIALEAAALNPDVPPFKVGVLQT
jgi:acetyl-CoA carboxylase carboxyltransferase component